MNGIKPHGVGIQISFQWNGKRHRPTLRIEPSTENLKLAQQLKAEIERAIALNLYTMEQYARHFPTSQVANQHRIIVELSSKKVETFGEVAEKYFATIGQLGHGTKIKYRQSVDFWKGQLANLPVDTIKFSDLAKLANGQGWNAKHRNNMLTTLRGVFEVAQADNIITENPARLLKNGKVQRKVPDPFKPDEVKRILEYMNAAFDPQIHNIFEFIFFSGMRPSEIIALQWHHVDWNLGVVHVQRARTFNLEHDTKTHEPRAVELNSHAQAALERQKEFTLNRGGYIFRNPRTGMKYPSEAVLRSTYWNRTLKALSLRHRTFYKTRHTFASLNITAGAREKWIADQLGHANTNMLNKVYGTWIRGVEDKERTKLDSLFAG